VIINTGDRILYNTDSRGRVLSEVRRDENDKLIGEIINTWSGDRLVSVVWKSEDEERIVEYEYDAAGDRVVERNLRNGVLERTVRREGEQEIEELYLNGELALRAVWAEGRKISEEPVRAPGNRRRSE
jgi:YD repeat-containing protein